MQATIAQLTLIPVQVVVSGNWIYHHISKA